MPKFVATWAATPDAVQQTIKRLPERADLGNGIRQYAHFFSGSGKMCCVFEAPNEMAIERFLKEKQPNDLYRVDYEWDRATGKFIEG
ncbi:MAG: hypothetical protein HY282_05060 [Nitrospirae bacterium]|nr:hypothetical protein [Candidatus Manganitrophaceae bacterium]